MDLLIPLALFIASKFTKAKATADRLEYFPTNLEIIKGKLFFKMDILNPTNTLLKIDSFFGGVYANDKKIGSIEHAGAIPLKAKARTKVQFRVKLGLIDSIKFFLEAAKGKFKATKFKVAGVARALGVDNPVSHDLTLTEEK